MIASLLFIAAQAQAGCAYDQTNTTAPNVTFPIRNNATNLAYAQPFVPTVTGSIGCYDIYAGRIGTPPNPTYLSFEIRADAGGVPAGTNVGWLCNAAAWALPTTPNILTCGISCPNGGVLTAGLTYWAVVYGTYPVDPSNYCVISGNTPATYPGNVLTWNGTSWSVFGGGGYNLWFREAPCFATMSPTPTRTFTVAGSVTATLTPSGTSTESPTATESPSVSETTSPTASRTRTISRTPTSTRSDTATLTESGTPTPTETATETPIQSATETATETDSFTATASSTRTRTESPTPTESWTPSATATESSTVAGSPTASRTSTATGTAVFTATPTSSNTHSRTATGTETPTATITTTALPTHTATATPPCPGIRINRNEAKSGDIVIVTVCGVTAPDLDVTVWNSAGERIRRLYVGPVDAATRLDLPWDLTSDSGGAVASNVYVVFVRANGKDRLRAKVGVVRE